MKNQERPRDAAPPEHSHPRLHCPYKMYICSHAPGSAHLCSWCFVRRFGGQTAREMGFVKYASDQIQPTASDLSSQSLWIPSLRSSPAPRQLPVAPLTSFLVWLLPECFVSSGLQVGGEGPGKIILTLGQYLEGQGLSCHQPSGLPGTQTLGTDVPAPLHWYMRHTWGQPPRP